MPKYKLPVHGVLGLILIACAFIALGTHGQNQKKGPPVAKGEVRKQRELPVVDFDSKEPTDAGALARRRSKGRRYDRQSSQIIQEAPQISGRVWSNHWLEGLSAIPVLDSDVILTGGVLDAKAHLSNDKTGIYSEFDVQVEEVLKNSVNDSLNLGTVISIERFGGAVRFASGAIQRYETKGQGMPLLGAQYLFFLKRVGESDFTIITAYQLNGQMVSPLDGSVVEDGTGEYPFDVYRGFDSLSFLRLVKSEIAKK